MRTIFFYGKPFHITSVDPSFPAGHVAENTLPVVNNPEASALEDLIESAKEEMPGYVLVASDEDAMFRSFQRIYHPLEAAGGLITDPDGAVLLIFRRRRWDLPKGKIDAGESPQVAAIREVREETGLSNIRLGDELLRTWHGYRQENDRILKETHWFRMFFTGGELTVPQIEEDITDIQWIQPENIAKYLRYSYPNLPAVFRAAGYEV